MNEGQLLDVTIVIGKVAFDDAGDPYTSSLIYRLDVQEQDFEKFLEACKENSVHIAEVTS